MKTACRRAVLCVALPLLLTACQPESPESTLTPGPPGSLPVEVTAMLFGDETPCRSGDDCLTGQCLFGRCSGLTRTDEPWRTELVADRLRNLIGDDKALLDAVRDEILNLVLADELSMPTRARFIWALERIGGLDALRRLDAGFAAFPEQIQVVVATARLRLGDPAHADLVLAQTDSDRAGNRIEALRALGGCRTCPPETKALVSARLLGTVFGEVAHEEARAALDALVSLGDRTTLGSIVELLATGPEALRDPAAVALAKMTGLRHGRDLAAWRAWGVHVQLPPAPAFTPFERRTEDDIGLPEP